jgi:16S rRNA (guanine527-N7)-methyltransferase
VRDPREMVARHLLDSLAVHPHLDGDTLADLGSGAGLPGIPLAIAAPQRRVTLVESNGKKARFLREAQRSLALANVTVAEQRAESARPAMPVDAVVARALAALRDLCLLAEPWLGRDGRLYAMKGPGHEAEVAALPPGWEVVDVRPLAVPDLDGDRWLVVLKRSGPRPAA